MTQRDDSSLYETKDIQARPLLIFLSGLTIMCLCTFLAVGSMSTQMTKSVVQERAADHPMSAQRQPPSAPLLQAHPTLEIEAHRARVTATLNNFGWIDRQEGIVHLPIELAKEVFLQRNSGPDQGGGK